MSKNGLSWRGGWGEEEEVNWKMGEWPLWKTKGRKESCWDEGRAKKRRWDGGRGDRRSGRGPAREEVLGEGLVGAGSGMEWPWPKQISQPWKGLPAMIVPLRELRQCWPNTHTCTHNEHIKVISHWSDLSASKQTHFVRNGQWKLQVALERSNCQSFKRVGKILGTSIPGTAICLTCFRQSFFSEVATLPVTPKAMWSGQPTSRPLGSLFCLISWSQCQPASADGSALSFLCIHFFAAFKLGAGILSLVRSFLYTPTLSTWQRVPLFHIVRLTQLVR